ncbi:TetR/AcrR family transcriptional regulator [Streptomyces hydrogenans]|uniref:Transcriptional regulator, TetR family protein n=1 Tax=Streptomyces hydrogenans TaxID=1873719 RepID=A0ABQ3P579_9ACTN|nr:TetR/AcrR family transcriptional regulator [Streptomyces hydrogenans]GHG44331.1 putative transcriptional regulator, TetR family protein [Streptomyces hydrogenans]GHI20177.1 putative transcriptional regulator, TetR family protein [Streptomyces hydrogenans]
MPRLSAAERREQLAEAAIRVMIRDGVAETTTRAVVAEAGVPLGAFHYCFRSKEELFQTVIERIMERNLPPAGLAHPPGATPFEKVRAILHAYWEQVLARPAEHLVTYEVTQYALRRPGLADLARRQYRHYLEVNRAHLESMARAAGLTWTVDLAVLARHGLGVLDGLTLTWLIDRDDVQALAALDEYARYLASVAEPLPAEGGPAA